MIILDEILIIFRLIFLGIVYTFDIFKQNLLIPNFLLKKAIKNDIVLITGAG